MTSKKDSGQVAAAAQTIAPAAGKLGVMVVGMGAVATTLIAGVEAVRRGFAKPIGSVTQMGTIRLGKRTDNTTPLIKDFVPLADVPDLVWKVGPHKRGGMTSPEHANHFADMDRELDPTIPEGATLLEICDGKPQNVAVAVWQRYYDAVKKQFPQKESRGLLPFRVWQIYDAMVSFVRAGQADAFVCAACSPPPRPGRARRTIFLTTDPNWLCRGPVL